jgi:hypothetical protein
VGEEQVLIVGLIQSGESRRDPDQDLLHSAEAAGAEPGIDADPHAGGL